ncbi:hypothetical protein ACNHUS_18490 [Actinomycetes bacterium M1A6_2h]
MNIPPATFFTRAKLVDMGVTDNDIKRARRRGTIHQLCRGAFVDARSFASMTAGERHVMMARAASATNAATVVSHQSAAVVHGLQMWNPDLSRVHLSVNSAHHGRKTAQLHVHTNRLDQVVVVEGLVVTSIARTAVDLARSLNFEAAVCVCDSALRIVTRRELEEALACCSGMDGASNARRVVKFADGRSETVGESRSRVYVQRHGFPAPELQVPLRNPHTGTVVRPDMLLRGVILEFDGKLKYASQDVLFQEKKREDELTSLGWVVVRWTWDDLSSDAGAVKLARGMERAEGLPPPLTIRLG